MKYVHSTLATACAYVEYGPGNVPRVTHSVVIPGGNVVTEVSDEAAAFLEGNADFERHAKAGFVAIRDVP